MKKCPVCERTFDDSMRFCQTDGTPLVEEAPEDPYKTVVAGKDEIAAAIPPEDPFKTMVAGGSGSQPPKEESGDLLQLPEEKFDPAKTLVVDSQRGKGQNEELIEPVKERKEEVKVEPIKASAPPSPFDNAATPSQPPAEQKPDVFSPPDPPKFKEPSVAPPSFSGQTPAPNSANLSGGFENSESFKDDSGDKTVMYPSNPLPPLSKESSEPPPTVLGDSPFGKLSDNAPIPSPFGDAPKPSLKTPPSPPPFKEPESPSPFGSQNNPFDQASFNRQDNANQNLQQSDWTPPPAPDAGWQNQNVGQNTPFQPPPAAGGGQNQTLPIVSLVLGIVSVCCPLGVIAGLGAIITGFLGMKNANNNPGQFGGKGLAIAGLILGGIFFLLSLLWWILQLLGMGIASLGSIG